MLQKDLRMIKEGSGVSTKANEEACDVFILNGNLIAKQCQYISPKSFSYSTHHSIFFISNLV